MWFVFELVLNKEKMTWMPLLMPFQNYFYFVNAIRMGRGDAFGSGNSLLDVVLLCSRNCVLTELTFIQIGREMWWMDLMWHCWGCQEKSMHDSLCSHQKTFSSMQIWEYRDSSLVLSLKLQIFKLSQTNIALFSTWAVIIFVPFQQQPACTLIGVLQRASAAIELCFGLIKFA